MIATWPGNDLATLAEQPNREFSPFRPKLMLANPSWRKLKQGELGRLVEWWLRLPGDALLRAEWLLLQTHRPGIVALASTWATPGPALGRVLDWAQVHDDVELRQALVYNHRLPREAQVRLWDDPDVRVRATALESLRPPPEVLLRLVHDPAIQRQHFRS